jgi:hypothetical protein
VEVSGSAATEEDAHRSVLSGRWLVLARVTWIVVAAAAVTLSVVGLPARYAKYRALSDYGPAVRDTVRSNLADLGLSVGFYAAYLLALGVLLALACFVVAAVIFWRRSNEPMALFVAMLLVLLGATFSGSIGALGDLSPIWKWLGGVSNASSFAFVFLFFYLFPDGRFVPRWTRWLVLPILAYAVPTALFPDSPASPENWAALPYTALLASLLLTGVYAQIHRYRRVSSRTERQQTKWVVFGFAAALAGYLGVIALQIVFPDLEPGTSADLLGIAAALCFMLLIPSSVAFAALRYRLYDIDLIINRTLVYGGLTATLFALYFGVVVVLQKVFVVLTGQESTLAVVASTLLIAALFNPLRRRMQKFIDRRFYRRKYDARKTLETFSDRLRDETNLEALKEELVRVVGQTMQPAHVALWLHPGTAAKGGSTQVYSPSAEIDAPPDTVASSRATGRR